MSKTWKWRESADVVARLMDKKDLKGIRSTDVILGPGEAGVLIKNGKIEDTITQTRVRKVGSSLLDRAQNLIFGSEDLQILLVDTRPIDVNGKISNTSTKDHIIQGGSCTLRFKIDLDSAPKLINLMKGRDKLTTNDIRQKINQEITGRIFSPYISSYTADEFRGSTKIQDGIENEVLTDMRKTLDMWGLDLLNLNINWDISKQESVEREIADTKLDERRKYTGVEKAKGKIDRKYEVKGHQEQSQYEYKDQHGEHVRDLDKKETGYKREKELTGTEHEENVKDVRTYGELGRRDKTHKQQMTEEEREFEQDKTEIEEALMWKEKMQRQKMERQAHETEQEVKKYQGTKLESEKVHADVEKTKAQTDAEKAKYNMDTYKEAEDRERDHQKDMLDQTAKIMNASKQNVPNTYVQGAERASANVNVREERSKGRNCPNCGMELQDDWKICPRCGSDLN